MKSSVLLLDLDNTIIPSDEASEEALAEIVGLSAKTPAFLAARALVKGRLGEGVPSARNRGLYLKALLEADGSYTHAKLVDTVDKYEACVNTKLQKAWARLGRDDLMDKLKQTFREIVVVTNETVRTQTGKLKAIDSTGRHFRHVVISEEVGVDKPAPKIFHEALRRVNAMPAEAVMVGDRLELDISPALALGMRAVWTKEFLGKNNNNNAAPTPAGAIVIQRLEDLLTTF